MLTNYYVQGIAQNYLKNIAEPPKAFTVHPSFMRGLEPDEFYDGFTALHGLMRGLLSDIIQEPETFGMLLKECVEDDPKNPDYTNSNASFIRVPNLLLVLGVNSALTPDGVMQIEGQALSAAAKELKITNTPFLLGKLRDYGFVIEGLGKTVKPNDMITLTYPDCPSLTAALKAMAEALLAVNKGDIKKSKNFFYMLNSKLLANDKGKAPKLEIDDMLRTIEGEQRAAVRRLHDFAAQAAKPVIKMGGFMRNDWSCVYTANKSNRVLMTIHVNQDKVSAKLNLQHIGGYIDRLRGYSGGVLETIRSSGWDCGHCSEGCSGGFAFELDGQSYNKCRCGSFLFDRVAADTVTVYEEMLQMELESA